MNSVAHLSEGTTSLPLKGERHPPWLRKASAEHARENQILSIALQGAPYWLSEEFSEYGASNFIEQTHGPRAS